MTRVALDDVTGRESNNRTCARIWSQSNSIILTLLCADAANGHEIFRSILLDGKHAFVLSCTAVGAGLMTPTFRNCA